MELQGVELYRTYRGLFLRLAVIFATVFLIGRFSVAEKPMPGNVAKERGSPQDPAASEAQELSPASNEGQATRELSAWVLLSVAILAAVLFGVFPPASVSKRPADVDFVRPAGHAIKAILCGLALGLIPAIIPALPLWAIRAGEALGFTLIASAVLSVYLLRWYKV